MPRLSPAEFSPLAMIEKKYLKTMMQCHECAGTLDASDINKDG
jgi:hypothetical protein